MTLHVLTPAAGKRLIGRAIVAHPSVQEALSSRTVVIVAGTTNGYVAEELLQSLGQGEGFSRKRFFRGVTLPPGQAAPPGEFPGDVVLVRGQWHRGKTLFDVVDELEEGDVILKGANAVNLASRRAGVLIGDRKAGTAGATLLAVVGRRVRLVVPVGLEKRVADEVFEVAAKLDAPGSEGPRLMPLPGEVITELEAIQLLTGATATLVAAGGVAGAEGCVWLGIEGTEAQRQAAASLLRSVEAEPAFEL